MFRVQGLGLYKGFGFRASVFRALQGLKWSIKGDIRVFGA